ncbi:Malectin-like domain, partial [Dillenia turbinata]
MAFPQGAQTVSVEPKVIKYPDNDASTLIVPEWIYASAAEMVDSNVSNPNFNLTWEMSVDPNFSYFIRLHFCDIVCMSLNDLYFNVYISGLMGISTLDLSTINNGALAVAYFKDFVLDASLATDGSIMVQVGPSSNGISSFPNAIRYGLEVLKLNNSVGSLNVHPQLMVPVKHLILQDKMLRVGRSKTGPLLGFFCIVLVMQCAVKQEFFTFKELEKATKNWDEKAFVAKVSDFRLLKASLSLERTHVSTAVKGSFGNLDPECYVQGKSTLPREQVNLAEWVMQRHRKGLLEKITDPYIVGKISAKSWESMLKLQRNAWQNTVLIGLQREMCRGIWSVLCSFKRHLHSLNSDACSSFIALEKPSEKAPISSSPVATSEDSLVSVGSLLFSQIENFQGRNPRREFESQQPSADQANTCPLESYTAVQQKQRHRSTSALERNSAGKARLSSKAVNRKRLKISPICTSKTTFLEMKKMTLSTDPYRSPSELLAQELKIRKTRWETVPCLSVALYLVVEELSMVEDKLETSSVVGSLVLLSASWGQPQAFFGLDPLLQVGKISIIERKKGTKHSIQDNTTAPHIYLRPRIQSPRNNLRKQIMARK